MPLFDTVKLGKQARKHLFRTAMLQDHTASTAPAPPAAWDWTKGVTNWGMMLNGPNSYGKSIPADGVGDCIIADGYGHGTQVWTLNSTSAMVTPDDSAVLGYYEKWCGYNPLSPGTDQGGVLIDVLNHWRNETAIDTVLDGFASVHIMIPSGSNGIMVPEDDLQRAIWMFGGAYAGVQLPASAQGQDVWDVPSQFTANAQPGSWGGHAIYLVAYDAQHVMCITWGLVQKMTWRFFYTYCDEAYALVSNKWLSTSGVSPTGLNLTTLLANQHYVTG